MFEKITFVCYNIKIVKNRNEEEMRILGVDPGTAIVGYSIIEFDKGKYNVLDYGCIYTDKDEDMPVRLEKIYDSLDNLIKLWKPTDMAIEDLFFSRIRRR